jgi:hypothetical protein
MAIEATRPDPRIGRPCLKPGAHVERGERPKIHTSDGSMTHNRYHRPAMTLGNIRGNGVRSDGLVELIAGAQP